MTALQTINPSTGEFIQSYPVFNREKIEALIDRAHAAFLKWRLVSVADRAVKINAVSEILEANKKDLARLITTEMGKPITMAIIEIEKCAWGCRYFAEHTPHYLQPKVVPTEASKAYVSYQPTGTIFAIMPWNYPFWQVFRFAAPNIMAGNTAIIKHAPITTGCGQAIVQIFKEAGFAESILDGVIIEDKEAEFVIQHPLIAGVTLTGSQRAGSAVAAQAGAALKKTVLELGGNDPYIILEDADLDHAVETCVSARMVNSGQVCIAAKRIIVPSRIFAVVEAKVLARVQEYRLGDPLLEETVLGPLARADLRDKVAEQVKISITKGAVLLIGGEVVPGNGFYYLPTLLSHVTPDMPAFDEEIFGPVVALIRAADEGDAIRLANMSPYGLGAAVFTRDSERGEKIAAQELEAGTCAVNTHVTSDPRLPFGGTKFSGFGRELGIEGIHEFMNIKTVIVK